MKRTDVKTDTGRIRRPTLWDRQGKSPLFKGFPAQLPYPQNFMDLR